MDFQPSFCTVEKIYKIFPNFVKFIKNSEKFFEIKDIF